MSCPICRNCISHTLKGVCIELIPDQPIYNTCLNCGVSFQDPLPPKKIDNNSFLMSEEDKQVNQNLAKFLNNSFCPRSVLDIGSKYPYFLSNFEDVQVLGIDLIDTEKYGADLNVPVLQLDFEIGKISGVYDLITLIHSFNYFHTPLKSLKKIASILTSHGTVFIRVPNVDVVGVDMSVNCPCFYSSQTMHILAMRSNLEIFKVVHFDGSGQSDFYLRKRKTQPELSVCMIVRDEEKNIVDCLESIKDIADELIVVDTGSVDNTKKIVSAYTDLVYDFKWVDDFSAARNFSLGKATGKFVLWVDADDIVENPMAIKDLLREKYDVFNFNVNYGAYTFCQARLFRNRCNVKFVGMVHEYSTIHNLNVKKTVTVNVTHKTEKFSTVNRSERNLAILQKELDLDCNNSRALFYMGNALKELCRYDQAIEIYNKYLIASTWLDEKWMAQKYIGQIYFCQGLFDDSIEAFEKAIAIDSRWAESYFYIGKAYYELKNYDNCIEWMLKTIEKKKPDTVLWKECHVYSDAPYVCLFDSYQKKGDTVSALKVAKKANELNPDKDSEDRVTFLEAQINSVQKIIECYRQGALGDCLMTTPALQGLKEKFPGCFIRYVTDIHSFQILEENKYIDELVTDPGNGATDKVYFSYPDDKSPVCSEGYPEKPLSRHLVQIFNECAGVKKDFPMECTLLEKEERVGETIKFQLKKYVTIHPSPGWSKYKSWYSDRWHEVIEYLFKKGYATVQIGHIDDPLLVDVVDFRGHSVKEAVAVIKYADMHMGVDSFSNHASVAVGTRAVVLFGSTSPTGSGYNQNINIYKGLKCQPCYKELSALCPLNKKCMELISVDEVIEAVDQILHKE